MMTVFSVGGSLNGKWQHHTFENATDAVKQTDILHEAGVMPVHIKKDGRLLDAPELEQILADEAKDANWT
jgi:hypothetical protein